jgi:hypothetical protein
MSWIFDTLIGLWGRHHSPGRGPAESRRANAAGTDRGGGVAQSARLPAMGAEAA